MSTTALLPSRAVISISGEEASTFLNGLITADMEDVDAGKPSYGALLTPQGKILFDFFAFFSLGGLSFFLKSWACAFSWLKVNAVIRNVKSKSFFNEENVLL